MESHSGNGSVGSFEVILHVYDLTKELNDKTYRIGLGIYHSGLEVDGTEYWFGGHEHGFTGLIELKPGIRSLGAMVLRESVSLGRTSLTRNEISELVDRLTLTYRGNSYHPIHRNCNHFADEFSRLLVKRGIPRFVNRLANIGSFFLHLFKEEWLFWMLSKFLPADATDRKNDGEAGRGSDGPRRGKTAGSPANAARNGDKRQRQRKTSPTLDTDREDSGLLHGSSAHGDKLEEVVVLEPESGTGPSREEFDAIAEFEAFIQETIASDAARQREVATSFFHLVRMQHGAQAVNV
eukprot:TRINITY_DN9559_c0_g1_i1.p2 TRINITY_DN9559_c0_g1~~TRINITY_DN9559_c0_g1_i1.p2  ORF type:complete len:294 (+),score=64.91 TRINITY_DN9559_c0_g1_i1:85-966(+)